MYLWMKLREMKEKWPELRIPYYPRETPYAAVKKVYEEWKRRVAERKRGSTVRSYLFMVLMGCQFLFSKILGAEFLGGFFEDQLFFVDKYEKLFLKLGERVEAPSIVRFLIEDEDDVSAGSGMSVEFRLVLCILFYSLVIILLRWLCSKFQGFGNEIKNRILKSLSGKEPMLNGILGDVQKSASASKAPRTPKHES